MDEDDKVIIYTRHIAVSQMLADYYKQAVTVFGTVAKSKKTAGLRRFKNGDAEMLIAKSMGMTLMLLTQLFAIIMAVPLTQNTTGQIGAKRKRHGSKSMRQFLKVHQ